MERRRKSNRGCNYCSATSAIRSWSVETHEESKAEMKRRGKSDRVTEDHYCSATTPRLRFGRDPLRPKPSRKLKGIRISMIQISDRRLHGASKVRRIQGLSGFTLSYFSCLAEGYHNNAVAQHLSSIEALMVKATRRTSALTNMT